MLAHAAAAVVAPEQRLENASVLSVQFLAVSARKKPEDERHCTPASSLTAR
jgi:hypothetical protein